MLLLKIGFQVTTITKLNTRYEYTIAQSILHLTT